MLLYFLSNQFDKIKRRKEYEREQKEGEAKAEGQEEAAAE